ncbi:restriction endonuclease subunit S [Cryobacterium sp. TMT2-10]|uniref:restriction endonuclease subunit S n=1 Tax=Cryobacterium sp. TMT2-10 TaxID=1259244 RepID=UPI00106C6AE3|nr:restriction endonuclease subunit S [Cryobacterium sp. TMT2-10]TFD36624.1 restriction endonuclease subunit S [Cryobacterium sp. TMT2-10]
MTFARARVGDIAQINPRLAYDVADIDSVSFLGMADVSELGWTNSGISRPYSEVKRGYTTFINGDLLVAKITPCFENGKIAQAVLDHETGVGSTEFHVIRPDSDLVDSRYLLHVLRSPAVRRAGEARMTGSAGQKRVPASYFGSLEIPLPPVPEQRRIAAVLDQADNLREKRRRALALLDELADSLFLECASTPGTPLSLKDCGVWFSSGKSVVGLGTSEHSSNRVLKVNAVSTGHFVPAASKSLPLSYSPPPSHRVCDGDLLFTRASGSIDLIGVSVFALKTPDGMYLPDKLWRVELSAGSLVSKPFLHALFRQTDFRSFVETEASGSSGVRNISQSNVARFRSSIPSRDAQRLFTRRTEEIDGARDSMARELDALDGLFASLQDRACLGEL